MTSPADPLAAVEALRRRAERVVDAMQAAQALETTATSADGAVAARVAGRRLVALTLEDAAESISPQQLGASIEQAVRAALTRNTEAIASANAEILKGAQ